jgi:hypothetical protein
VARDSNEGTRPGFFNLYFDRKIVLRLNDCAGAMDDIVDALRSDKSQVNTWLGEDLFQRGSIEKTE